MANAGPLAERLVPCKSIKELAAAIRPPRPIVLMVMAGAPVDEEAEKIGREIVQGDMLIDAGNANFRDTQRRVKELGARGFEFLGIGVSGGEVGARHGPSIMAGGTEQAWKRVEKILLDISAKFEGEPCAALMGPDGAGHFVKTIHNGIEYADMQMIAEVYGIMRDGLGMSPAEMADVFARWNEGRLKSYLIEITANVLEAKDPETGKPMVEIILDTAGQKGTGRWSAIEAQDLGVPATVIEAAVAARGLSAQRDFRLAGEKLLRQGRYQARRRGRRPRRDPRCSRTGAARRQDRRLCPGLRRALRRLRGVELEPADGHHRQDLARRLHHPLGLPRRHFAQPIRIAATSPT